MAYNPSNVNGQATMANSAPVVIASNQSAVPISDNGGSVTVDGSVSVSNFPATQPVSGTVTVQDGGGAITVDGTVEIGATSLAALESITVQNAGGASAVNIQDGGNSITVDGSVSVSNFPATQPISGSVSVSNFPATQPVSGPLTDAQLRATAVPISGTVSTGLTQPLTDTQLRATAVPISGTVTANAGTGTQNVSVQNASIPVTGTFFQATQPVSGTVTADTELPAATALGDSTANPTAPHIGSCIEAYNGATWDRIKTDTALAGNTANDSVVGILAVGTGPGFSVRLNPTNLGTAANSASTFNVDGAGAVTIAISTTTTGTFIIEGTADNTTFIPLEIFDGGLDLWVSGQNLTPTAGKVYQIIPQGYRQVRLRTVTTLGATVAHAVTLSNTNQFLGGIDTGAAPHNFGYTLIHRDAEYTTAQTGAALWTPATGRRFAVTDITISTGGTTSGIVTIWQGASADTTYTVGTDNAIFRGEFAPSATVKPGAIKSFNVPFVATTVDHVLRVTTSAAMTVYIQVNGYEI
jgi:hypothetical protein